MWIALLDFCIFMLLFGFFLFGLREWDRLLIDPDGEPIHPEKNPKHKNTRVLWMLIIGLGILSLISVLKDFFD
ncbi:MAG: hypothetical protein HQM08_26930 [Candidatus Riflebacteria bacterium]|nr:hypothetical protein [Candidatus Riflebacteria bacterium]